MYQCIIVIEMILSRNFKISLLLIAIIALIFFYYKYLLTEVSNINVSVNSGSSTSSEKLPTDEDILKSLASDSEQNFNQETVDLLKGLASDGLNKSTTNTKEDLNILESLSLPSQ